MGMPLPGPWQVRLPRRVFLRFGHYTDYEWWEGLPTSMAHMLDQLASEAGKPLARARPLAAY
jgi:hypothetical protein